MPKLRRFAELVPNLFWTCLPDGPCDYLSPQWVEYTGVPEAEQLGYGWLDSVHPDDRHRLDAVWSDAVASGSELDVDFRVRRHDGVYRWFRTRMRPDTSAAGVIERWYGSSTDIQDLHEAEVELAEMNRSLEARVQARVEQEIRDAEEIRRLKERLEEAQRLSHLASWSWSVESDDLVWSDELFRILRLRPEDGPPPVEEHHRLFSPESWERLSAALERALELGEGYELELELRPTEGGRRFAVARGEVERDAAGRAVRVFGTFQDVTELRRAQLERERAAQRSLLATEFAGIGVWEWRIGDERLSWDDRMYELYGIEPGTDVFFEDWSSALHPDHRDRALTELDEAVSGAETFSTVFRLKDIDNRPRYIKAASRVVRDTDGEATGMVGLNWDVTLETLAAEAIENSEAVLRSFVTSAPAALAMFDRDVRYVAVSERWMVDYGLEGTDVVGRSHYDVFPEIPGRWKEVHRSALQGNIHRHDGDRFVRADGSVSYLQWEVRPWHQVDGTVGGLMMFTRDVTELVDLQEALRQRSDELARSNRDLQQFAYAASHDLQEPLRAVAGCADILQQAYRGRLDGDADELIEHLVDGARRMSSLIEDLLTYSRVDTHGRDPDVVDTNDAIRAALENLTRARQESEANIAVHDLPAVHADRRQVTQLFQNLLSNAMKYRGEGPATVEIRSVREGGTATFSVRDRGIGIADEHRERVFEIFQRLHTREQYSGTGVGLSLCRRIVERHGGRIWIEPTEGPGVDFRFNLPVA